MIGTCLSNKHTPYEIMHLRKPRFPSEHVEEAACPLSVEDPTPNQVADYVSAKLTQLSVIDSKIK